MREQMHAATSFLADPTRTRVRQMGGRQVGTYSIETIIREWAKGNLTNEQAIGQILLLIQGLQDRLQEFETRLFRCEQKKRG
jgi:hypothetical protein